ncbi:nuclear RNA binding protein, putative [Trichophyton verrucosum HKI 0517]|uniref:Nuclear RNA binding protein, putative n=1 Tax=Trichophyton verrucosum (strain HKI 0517) TaxID=663202 RepID=D4CZ08_TRIVH|nr:nuclear RNA binding protein, putative [Trichophyton verrucosum HKI 0517]EFE45172.1 nuclear RNA binding protein, putative [Trichophyton verrucosum HKI 0517]
MSRRAKTGDVSDYLFCLSGSRYQNPWLPQNQTARLDVDRQLEDTLQQSAAQAAAADASLLEDGHGSPYYDRRYGSSSSRGRAVVTGPSKRKTYPYPYPETAAGRDGALSASTPSHRRRESSRDRYSVDVAGSYHSSSPQKRVVTGELPEQPTLRSRRGQDVTELRDRQERQSRFLEGSMNDKVSTRPPSVFIGEEQEYLLSTYMDEHNGGKGVNGWQPTAGGRASTAPLLQGKKGYLSSTKTNNTDATDAKSSGVFRFGKAIVSAINPMGVWGNVSEIWKGHDSSSKGSGSREMPVDTPHAARIEKAYQEYKASAAYRSTTPSTAPLHRYGYSGDDTGSPAKLLPVQTPQPQPSHHPSALIQSSISKELPPTPLEWQGLPVSTVSKRSSFQTIKGSRSFLNLSHSLRKEQSHKDLARENKLRKKVSNLEEKLLRYKRELSTFTHEEDKKVDELEGDAHAGLAVQVNNRVTHHLYPHTTAGPSVPSVPSPSPSPAPPSHDVRYVRMRPKKFVPGALPSLPSERLLDDGEPPTIREVSRQEASPEKPIYTRRSEPRLRRAVPRIREEDVTRTPAATTTKLTKEGASTPPSRKRKSPSPDHASVRRRRISATYSKNIRSNNNSNNANDSNDGASPPPSPQPNRRILTEKLTGPRPYPVNARTETEGRRNQPSRRAKEIKPVYYPNYDLTGRSVPVPERSESRPKHDQTPAPAPAKTPIPKSTPALPPQHGGPYASVEVAIPISVAPPIPSSTKPPPTPTSRQKSNQKQTADATANTASIPPPRPESVPATKDIISRSGSPRKHHNIPPRRKAAEKPISITPGKGGDENIPPVPPLPVEHGGSPLIEDGEFEWPEDIF